MFREQFKEAKAAVPDPPPPKIKIKVAPGQDTPASSGPKRITIHVANNRGSSAGSPAPQTGGSVSSDGGLNAAAARNPFSGQHSASAVQLSQLDRARSMSGPALSPSPAMPYKREDGVRPSPMVARPNGVGHGMYNGVGHGASPFQTQPYANSPLQNGYGPAGPNARTLYDQKFRQPDQGMLGSNS
jgi:hypothetical protein